MSGRVERDPAGDRGCRHRGARHGAVAAPLVGGVDALAGRDDVDVCTKVAEVREGVVDVGRAGPGGPPAADTVEVGQGGDGDDFVVGGRYPPAGVAPVVAGRDHVGDAGRNGTADGAVLRIAVRVPAVSIVGAGV